MKEREAAIEHFRARVRRTLAVFEACDPASPPPGKTVAEWSLTISRMAAACRRLLEADIDPEELAALEVSNAIAAVHARYLVDQALTDGDHEEPRENGGE